MGCEPGRINSLQPPPPPTPQQKKKNTKKKRDGSKTPKSNAEWVAWCADITGNSQSMSTQSTYGITPKASEPEHYAGSVREG